MNTDEIKNMMEEAASKVIDEKGVMTREEADKILADVEALKSETARLYTEKTKSMEKAELERLVGEFIYGSYHDGQLFKSARDKLHQITPRIPQCEDKIIGSANIPWLPVTLIADYMKDATEQWPLWVRANARIWPAVSKRLVIPVMKDNPSSLDYAVGEGSAPTCEDSEVCKEVLEWFKRAACMKIYDVAQVQAPEVAAMIPRLLSTRMFKAEEYQYWLGNGTNGPLGIATDVVAAGTDVAYTDIYQTLLDLMRAVGQYATDGHFYCGTKLYWWLLSAVDGAGYLYLPSAPVDGNAITRQFMVKGINKYVRLVPCLDNGVYDGYLFFGDLAHYHIIQHPGNGIIPLFGLERLGHTDEDAFLSEYSVWKIAALYGGRLNFDWDMYETVECERRTWSYADLSGEINTPYQGVFRVEQVGGGS